MPKCARMRSKTHAGAVRSPGRPRWRRLFWVLGSLPPRPAPARLAPRNSLFGAADFLEEPHKSKPWGPGGAGSTASRSPKLSGKRKWPSVAGWGRPEVTVPWGKSGAELGGRVCVCVCLECVYVFGVCWLCRSARAPRVRGRARQLADLAPRECSSFRVSSDLSGFDGRGVARVRETTFSAESGATLALWLSTGFADFSSPCPTASGGDTGLVFPSFPSS